MTDESSQRWTDEQVQLLVEWWKDGKTSNEIVANFEHRGVVRSRNSVIGKLQRLKLLTKKASKEHALRASIASRRSRKRKPAEPEPIPAAAPVVAPAAQPKLVSLEGLREGMCKWPIGDPLEKGFGFCGQPTEITKVYCPKHMDEKVGRSSNNS